DALVRRDQPQVPLHAAASPPRASREATPWFDIDHACSTCSRCTCSGDVGYSNCPNALSGVGARPPRSFPLFAAPEECPPIASTFWRLDPAPEGIVRERFLVRRL